MSTPHRYIVTGLRRAHRRLLPHRFSVLAATQEELAGAVLGSGIALGSLYISDLGPTLLDNRHEQTKRKYANDHA